MYELLLQWVGVIHDVFVFGVSFLNSVICKKKKYLRGAGIFKYQSSNKHLINFFFLLI